MKIICTKCRLEKESLEFSVRTGSKTGHQNRCKSCQNEYSRTIWYPKNRDKQLSSSKKWKQRNPRNILLTLANKYSIPIEEVKRIINNPENKCGICNSAEDLVFDHCHDTLKLRGLLCRRCNLLLGRMGDSLVKVEELMIKVRGYLEKTL